MQDRLLRIEEVAKIINYEIGSIYQMIHRGIIPHIKLSGKGGKSLRFSEKTIYEWINSHSVPVASPQTPTEQRRGTPKNKAERSVSSGKYIDNLIETAKKEQGI